MSASPIERRWHMLRLHRVGIGTFAAMFGLMVLGSTVRGEDDPFAKLMPRKVGSSACFHRDYDAAHLKQHPRQATQSIAVSLKYEIPESLHPSARVMMRRKGAKEPFYVAAGCGWGDIRPRTRRRRNACSAPCATRADSTAQRSSLQPLRAKPASSQSDCRPTCAAW